MRFGRVARVYLAANSGFARLRPTSMTTPKHLYFACLIVAAPVVDDPSCNALQPGTTPGTPQMSLAGTGSLHDRQEDALARNERGIFIRSVEIHDLHCSRHSSRSWVRLSICLSFSASNSRSNPISGT